MRNCFFGFLTITGLLFAGYVSYAQHPPPSPGLTPDGISAVWANEGGDKVTRDELRASSDPGSVINSVWNGTKVVLFGAKNEVVGFNLCLEASSTSATNVTLIFNQLAGPGGASIESSPASGDGVFDWTNRDIELFYIRYLQIKGLSSLAYESYDERHIPRRLRRPWTGEGVGSGTWFDRPDHDKYYPDIAVPLELVPGFDIAAGQNQSIWVDIYIPKNARAGLYTGTVTISENGTTTHQVPVELTVRGFTLPDIPSARTMLYLGYEDINLRYLGEEYPEPGTDLSNQSLEILNRHFQLAHRHKISLIEGNASISGMSEAWVSRLSGELFTPARGYRGPGEGTGNNVYSIGTYGSWPWQGGTKAQMWSNTDAWVNWFDTQAFTTPTDYFLYLIDESSDYPQIEQWAQWINSNPGPGQRLMSMATISLLDAAANTPSLDIPTDGVTMGIPEDYQSAADSYLASPDKWLYCYNNGRPQSGSFATEDDGVSLRELAWGQYKKKVDRWFYWESTYYDNFQGGTGQTNVFQSAHTFGGYSGFDEVLGDTGWNYGNGDGVLFYPGTDTVFPAESYGVKGPFASLRLKLWRRGIQDFDYLTLAAEVDPGRVSQIVAEVVPKVLWEYGVDDPNDPTWVRTDISWSIDPDVWEGARAELADIIESARTPILDSGDYDGNGTADIAIFRGGSGLWSVRGVTRAYFGTEGDTPVSGDYDGDGTTDVGIFRDGSGLWVIRGLTRCYFGSSNDQSVPGDYDGDGCCDIGIFRNTRGLWVIKGITRTYFGTSGDRPVPGDYDGDSTKDIAVFRKSSGLWVLRRISRLYFGKSSDQPVPGDYNGDGAGEVGIFRSTSALWALRGVTRCYFGSTSDQPVPGDYDGNSTDDIGIFRRASGLWVLEGITRAYHGTGGDMPVTR